MKSIILILSVLFLLSSTASAQDSFIESMNKAKSDLKAGLGDLKYDGSKSTYFQVKKEVTYKEVEVAVFLRENYHLFFDGSPAPSKVTLRIFDKPADNPDRIMLFEVKNISGKQKSVTVDELKEKYAYYVEDPEMLKNVYVDYEIAKGKPARAGVVMALGY
ncbi:MAG: hypothetical protein WEA99_07845 [Brumimicrobium sp.]